MFKNIYPDPNWIVGKHALMNTRAHVVGKKTIIEPKSWRIPFQWQGYHYQDHDDQPFMLMVNSGGGFVEGDGSYFFSSLEDNSRALFTTTASGKFYKCLNSQVSREIVEFNVGNNAVLEYLPDEAIPFANSRSDRSIKINLMKSSRMFASDMVSAGRVHYGKEIFKFHSLRSSFEIFLEGKVIGIDKVILKNPTEVSDLHRLWKGAYHSAVIFCYAPEISEESQKKVVELTSVVEDTEVGISCIENLMTIRILSKETWQAHEAIYFCWKALRPMIAKKEARPILKC